MPVDHSIQSLLAPADSSFASPVKASAGDGARREESNGENGERSGSDSDGNAKSGDKPKRPWNGRADYRLVETWDTGENRTQDVEISRNELYLLAANFSKTARPSSFRRINLSQPIFTCGNSSAPIKKQSRMLKLAYSGVP